LLTKAVGYAAPEASFGRAKALGRSPPEQLFCIIEAKREKAPKKRADCAFYRINWQTSGLWGRMTSRYPCKKRGMF
jgi:hypothetical protein